MVNATERAVAAAKDGTLGPGHVRAMALEAASFAGTLPAILRTEHHEYIHAGVTYPGVTSVLKVIDKPALIPWAARQAAEAALQLHEGGTLAPMIASVGREGAVKAIANRANWQKDEAAALGSAVHHWADQMITGAALPDLSPTAQLYAKNYADWWQRSGWRLRVSEAVILSPGDGADSFGGWGGTFDLLAYDEEDRTVLADIKTGSGVYRETILQLTAYGMAQYVSRLGGAELWPMVTPDRYVVIHVTRDGVRPVEVSIGRAERYAWLACLSLWNWTKTVKGKL